MDAPRAISQPGRRDTLRIVELTECGAHVAPDIFILGHLAEEDEMHPFQGLCDLDGVDDVVERCAQVHDSDV
jgi:hypothetical protein